MSLISALLFPVPPPSYNIHSFPGELLWIPSELDYRSCKPGDCVPGVFLQCPNARYIIVYLHSNGEDIGLCYPFGCGLRLVLEVHVLLVEYPGYGLCPGRSSEETLWEAVDAAFRFVCEVLRWPKEDVIVMGRSLGAALATRLARKHACHGLIVVAPFLSLVEAVGQYAGGSLARACVGDIFSNREHMRAVEVPTMVIHGKRDRLIPCSQGQRLFDLCPHKRKVLVTPEEMGHNCNLLGNPDFLVRPILRFFSLPDYTFDELAVPPEAFDKRLCLQYHNLMEMTKRDVPLAPLLGDQEPLACGQCQGPPGPQSHVEQFPASNGDLDDLPELQSEATGNFLQHTVNCCVQQPADCCTSACAPPASFSRVRPATSLRGRLPRGDTVGTVGVDDLPDFRSLDLNPGVGAASVGAASALARPPQGEDTGADSPGNHDTELNHVISCHWHESRAFEAL